MNPSRNLSLHCRFLLGLSETEFLSNMEQFDKSSASWNVPLARDWRIISNALNAPRYEMTVASIPISKVRVSFQTTLTKVFFRTKNLLISFQTCDADLL